jgi:CBS domain-containing protein
VADVMTGEVVRARPDQSLKAAAHLMVERTVKRLAVVDKAGHLIGILSRVDVLRTMGEDYHAPEVDRPGGVHGTRTVGELMRTDVPSVPANASLGEVLDKVTSTCVNRAIIVDRDGLVIGIVTDADLLARLDPGGDTGVLEELMGRGKARPNSTLQARDLMRTPAITATPETPVAEAVKRMLQARRKVLPS